MPSNECDHVVGYQCNPQPGMDAMVKTRLSQLTGSQFWIDTYDDRFSFCPNCGADLTEVWVKKIKEKCDAENNGK